MTFDGRGGSLREIILTIANYEGAHAINVRRLVEVQRHKPLKLAWEPQLHILNDSTLFEVRYPHLIVIEAALYLYERLLDETSIQRPTRDICMVKQGYEYSKGQTSSGGPVWLRFDGTMMMVVSNEPRFSRHIVRPVN